MSKFHRGATGAAAVALTLCVGVSARAGGLHDEGTDGDLSGDRKIPTALGALSLGNNTVRATSVSGDREYFSMIVPAGAQLAAITLISYSLGEDLSFIAVQSGATFTEPPTGTVTANLLGWTHFNSGLVGDDILDDLGAGFDAIGFTGPLGSGVYTFWSQQTGPTATTYELDFVVTPAPGAWIGGAALGAVGLLRRRRTG